MKALTTLLAVAFLTTNASAQDLPPIPEGGLFTVQGGPCVDNVTGRHGDCVIQVDLDGNQYVIFLINNQIELIRMAIPDGGYVTLYQRGEHNL